MTQEELFTLKGRVQTLREKMNNAKENYENLKEELEKLSQTVIDGSYVNNPNFQNIMTVKFSAYIIRIYDYIDELKSLNETDNKYIEMLEELFGDYFPDMEFEKK